MASASHEAPALPAHGQRFFIADLHLDGQDSPRALRFRALLEALARQAGEVPTELFILGDLFEFWEEYHAQIFELYARDLSALEAANRAGVGIVLLAGNRDFAYGRYAQQRLGARLWDDGGKVILGDARKAWVEHGDLLCTADTRYLRYRRWIRSWPVRLYFRMIPWSSARRTIDRITAKARADKARKDEKVLEIDIAAARERCEARGCQVLLCGHTHRPQATDLGDGKRLLVVPPWCDVFAGYREVNGNLAPFCFHEDGSAHAADETGRPRLEAPAPKRRLWG